MGDGAGRVRSVGGHTDRVPAASGDCARPGNAQLVLADMVDGCAAHLRTRRTLCRTRAAVVRPTALAPPQPFVRAPKRSLNVHEIPYIRTASVRDTWLLFARTHA